MAERQGRRWKATVEGVALRNLFQRGVVDATRQDAPYVDSIHQQHNHIFSHIAVRNFRLNYKKAANVFITEQARHGIRRDQLPAPAQQPAPAERMDEGSDSADDDDFGKHEALIYKHCLF